MTTVKTEKEQNDQKIDIEEIEGGLSEVSALDIYSTIKRWEALYPHTFGDQLLEDLLGERK